MTGVQVLSVEGRIPSVTDLALCAEFCLKSAMVELVVKKLHSAVTVGVKFINSS